MGRRIRAEHFDADGRLTGFTVYDPWFDDSDTDGVLERHKERSLLCPGGCGQPIYEAWDHENGPAYGSDNKACRACTKLAALSESLRDEEHSDFRRFPIIYPLEASEADQQSGEGIPWR